MNDLEQAVYFMRKAAVHGDDEAQYVLAWFYENAVGVEQDDE